MTSPTPVPITPWLTENGPRELESLFRAIVFQPSAPVLIVDDERRFREASIGVSKCLGLPREEIIGRRLEEFAVPAIQPLLSERWHAFLKEGDQTGTFQMLGPDGAEREIEYVAKRDLLPGRHLLFLRNKAIESDETPATGTITAWAQDYALSLLDADGAIATWYAGAERIYGYKSDEVVGHDLSMFYPPNDGLQARVKRKVEHAAYEGYVVRESWQMK